MPVRLCAACLGENGLDSIACSACGAVLAADPAGVAGKTCPTCGPGSSLKARRLGEVAIESCDRCDGLFLARDAVEEAYGRLGARRDRASSVADVVTSDADVRYRACPTCGDLMHRRLLGTGTAVVLDRCSVHGTWFDRGELARAVRFVQGGGREQDAREAARSAAAMARPASPVVTPTLGQRLTIQAILEVLDLLIGL